MAFFPRSGNESTHSKNSGKLVRNAIIFILIIIGFSLICNTTVASEADYTEKPNILILHSYDPTYDWTIDVTDGIISTFDDSVYSGAEFYIEYMNARRYSDKEYGEVLENVYKTKYNNSEFDLIIAADDHAINFICSEKGLEIFGNAPVVFCGANSYNPAWNEIRPQTTGLMESIEPLATLEMIPEIQPDVKKIVVVNDNMSLTSINVQKSIASSFSPDEENVQISYLNNVNKSELISIISTLPGDSALFLINFNMDTDGNYYSAKESINFVSENANVPVYGIWKMQVDHGLMGGKVIDGTREGVLAAEVAIRVLDGEDASSIPILFEPHNNYVFNREQMERFSISEKSLPEGSIIINGTPSFYEQYKTWVWVAIIAVGLQSLSSGMLLVNRSRLHKTRKELVDATKRAKRNEKIKSLFLANMSHEIRTPMNTIIGFSEILKNPKIEPEKSDHYIDLISKSGKNLMVIIDDVLDISRIESEDIEIFKKPVCLNNICDELYNVFSSRLISERKNVELRVNKSSPDPGPSIISDETRLRQILFNLVGNAIKFTDSGYIEYGYTIKGNYVEFYVKDTGSGIPEDMQDTIFTRFHQAMDGSPAMYKGTGLGLSISKSLVELMGGRIWFESKYGEGASFFFTLPLHE